MSRIKFKLRSKPHPASVVVQVRPDLVTVVMPDGTKIMYDADLEEARAIMLIAGRK